MTSVIEKIFDSLDADKDGSISQAELEGIFKLFDEDGDGQVSRAEFKAAYSTKLGGTAEHGDNVFGHLDSDKDGNITVQEISALFKKMDQDGDGTVSRQEFIDAWSKMLS